MFQKPAHIRAKEREEEEQAKKTDEGVQLRKKQGEDTTTGEQVWYSRRVENGCQIHWVIITHGKKYELRLPNGVRAEEKVPEDQRINTFEPPREYEDRILPWSLKEEANRLRTLNLTRPTKGHTQDYIICQIGWTALTGDEVDAKWKAARKAIEANALSFDDCLALLRDFADIIKKPEGCALDYAWFAETLEIPSHRLHEITPEKAVRSFQRMLQSGGGLGLAGAGAGAGIAYGAYEAGEMMESMGRNGNVGVPAAAVDGTCGAAWCCSSGCWDWSCCELCVCLPCAGGGAC
ncbi:hypothetical protein CDEST_09438 [Colletotrichum destructivum]|uniref:Uncharacterized protein n=1 Tax=Colletotrichum destructivum TaxID=34406 RepID=A0AAX4IM90_9PEZI|nr:hypothetical protein CDEST_09438 [Colletotrichum destructivum]